MNLFENAPLAARLRPQTFDDFIGQKSVIAKIKASPLHSMILYGPPGCGKTTLAKLIAGNSKKPFQELSAVSSGIAEVREVIGQAKKTGQIVLFIDEIHRFSKSQQDALLQAVESGWIILIGATTENPSFEVIGPLLSRSFVYRLQALSEKELEQILTHAIENDPSLQSKTIEEEVIAKLIEASRGDARKLLGFLELISPIAESTITLEKIQPILESRVRLYDKKGDNHYDYISAFIKSMRGSDPDAAILYLACMIDAGEDPLFIARRMIIFASEDVGNASIQALELATNCFIAIERIGMPEGRIVLAQTAAFLASCPKSNAAYMAINQATAAIEGKTISIPNHLRNAPTETHRKEGASIGYLYPHDFPHHYVPQTYLPDGFEKEQYYFPSSEGNEGKIKERLRLFKRKNREYEEK